VSLFAELFNEMLQRDFGYRIYKALAALPTKEERKDKKVKKEVKEAGERREVKKEEAEEPAVKKPREDEDKRKVRCPPCSSHDGLTSYIIYTLYIYMYIQYTIYSTGIIQTFVLHFSLFSP